MPAGEYTLHWGDIEKLAAGLQEFYKWTREWCAMDAEVIDAVTGDVGLVWLYSSSGTR